MKMLTSKEETLYYCFEYFKGKEFNGILIVDMKLSDNPLNVDLFYRGTFQYTTPESFMFNFHFTNEFWLAYMIEKKLKYYFNINSIVNPSYVLGRK